MLFIQCYFLLLLEVLILQTDFTSIFLVLLSSISFMFIEILRVLRKIPVMRPATHNGESVAVLCSIILSYGDEIEVEAVYIPERPDN